MRSGFVHSTYSGGMVDGPGIRYVVFLSGCPLRCKYCHNPDSWAKAGGKEMTVQQIMDDIITYKNFFRSSGGGVTISGGEPFMQPDFLLEILLACKAEGIHTAIDTSGYASEKQMYRILPQADLLLFDVKGHSPETFTNVTGVFQDKNKRMLEIARELDIDTWARYVLVPGLTDDIAEITDLKKYLDTFPNVKRIDVLPFHKHGEDKWAALKFDYELADTQPPSKQLLAEVKEILRI